MSLVGPVELMVRFCLVAKFKLRHLHATARRVPRNRRYHIGVLTELKAGFSLGGFLTRMRSDSAVVAVPVYRRFPPVFLNRKRLRHCTHNTCGRELSSPGEEYSVLVLDRERRSRTESRWRGERGVGP